MDPIMDTYDLVVIGAGPAGQSAAELAAFLGHSVLIVERARPGGTVTTTGGAPTKTLREVALSLAADRPSLAFAEALPVVRARTLEVCRTLQEVVARQLDTRGIAYVQGAARLIARDRISIDLPDGSRREIAARTIVLAIGSKPMRFPGVPFDDPDVYDSDEIFTMRRTPQRVVIAGGGPAGVEFTTIFDALGVAVTLVDRSARLLPTMDGELTEAMRVELVARGVTLSLGAGVTSVRRTDGG